MSAQIQKMRHALEAMGIVFIDDGRLAGGVIPPM